jgi:glyoxylase-like metal-dependent hydrolase (beta-lactamase superfamily II)
MSLLLQLEETGPVLLAAAADNSPRWDGQLPPRALYSRDDAKRSLERLRELARETDSLVVFGHDPDETLVLFERHELFTPYHRWSTCPSRADLALMGSGDIEGSSDVPGVQGVQARPVGRATDRNKEGSIR